MRVYGGERNGRNATAICYVWVWSPNTYSYLSCRARVTQAIQTDLLVHVYHRQYVIMLECLLLSMYRTCGAMHCLWSQALFASCYKMLMCCLVKEKCEFDAVKKLLTMAEEVHPQHMVGWIGVLCGLDRCAVCSVCISALVFQLSSYDVQSTLIWLPELHTFLTVSCLQWLHMLLTQVLHSTSDKYACTLVYWLQSCLNICMPKNCVGICMCCNHTYITVHTATMV